MSPHDLVACGGLSHCADCAVAVFAAEAEAADAGSASDADAARLFVGLRAQVAALTLERDRYRETLTMIANLADADCSSPGVAAVRGYAARMLRSAGADFRS